MYNKEVLDNGLRIITENIPQMPSVSVGIWVKVGSVDEDADVNGISHFLEHLMFKGTQKRTAKEIAEAIDDVGGYLNAFTSREYTCFYAKVLENHIDRAVDVLTDMVSNPLFREEDVEKERNVVLEEIKMYEDTPDEVVHDLIAQTYWANHPLGRGVLGTEANIQKMSKQQIIEYHQRYYHPGNMVVVAAGKVNHYSFVEKIKEVMGGRAQKQRTSKYTPANPGHQVVIRNKATEQVHFCLGMEGVSRFSDKYFTLQVMNSILGNSSSSRLFQGVREERGLAYSIYSYPSSYQNAGMFTVYAGTSYENFSSVIEIVAQELLNLKMEQVTTQELNRAKEQLKGSLLMALESTSARMSRIGKSELFYNRLIPIEEVVKEIDSVTKEGIIELAHRIFRKDKMALAVIGSVEDREFVRKLDMLI